MKKNKFALTIDHKINDCMRMTIKEYKRNMYKFFYICTRKEVKNYYEQLKKINVNCYKYDMGYYFVGNDNKNNILVAHAMNLSNKRYCFYVLKEYVK